MKKLLLVFALLCNGGGINPLWAQQQIPMHMCLMYLQFNFLILIIITMIHIILSTM